jgi:hypothetical protein
MGGKSLAGFIPYIQREVTPGTPLATAMKQVDGIRTLRPARGGSAEAFMSGTGKTAGGVILSDDYTAWSFTPASCFRALGYIAAGRIALPTTTTPVGATDARQHVFKLNPNTLDNPAFYTFIWGDGTTNFRSSYTAFQTLNFNAQRGSFDVGSSAIGRKYETSGISLPSSGVVDVPMQSMQPNLGDVWIENPGDWSDLGTTQFLNCYQFNLQLGDKYDMDAPINSSIVSYASLPEKEDQSMTVDLSVAVDTDGLNLVGAYERGDRIAIRYLLEGPEIEDGFPFSIQWDVMAVVTSVGEVTTAPTSNVATFPLSCTVAKDGTDALELTLVNDIASYAA